MSAAMLPRDARDTGNRPKRRTDYRPPPFVVDDVALTFDLDPEVTEVSATYAFRRNPDAGAARDSALVLDAEQQSGVRMSLDGRPVSADRIVASDSSIALLDAPASGTLTIRSQIAPARNVALEGLYLSSGVLCTQCEPEGFRRIAAFPDRPDVLARYDVTLRADARRYPTLLANGNLVAQGALDGGRHFARWRDPFPKPTYLFALVAGDLGVLEDAFVTASGRSIALQIHSTPDNLPRCGHAMDALKRAMRWDEQRFGREYDLDTFMIFCADDFNFGAMENKGLNIFNSRLLLAQPETATDDDFDAIESVVAHEYFHNWTGNRVTCRDWFQLSLKEGLTVFRDQEFSSDHGSRAVARIGAVEYLRREQFAEDAGPMAHPVRPEQYTEINNFYTATVYEKGAEIIRMQHTLLGPARFRAGTDLYFARHDGRAVTCDHFVDAMQDASGIDLTQFRAWYSQVGTPVVSVRGRHDAGSRTYVLDVEQRIPGSARDAPPLHIPFAVGLVGRDGRDLPLRLAGEAPTSDTTRVLELTSARHRFLFADIETIPVPSLLRGFSAPVSVEFDYDDASLALLASHDSDAVNRWDAAQRLFVNAILRVAESHRRGLALELPPPLPQIVARLLADDDSDAALRALALKLPNAAYVASLEAVMEPHGIAAALAYVERALAGALRREFEAAHARTRATAPYARDAGRGGRRSLNNRCLRYLGALDDAAAQSLAVAHYDAADNMTDAIGALSALRDSSSAAHDALFARFEARWRDEPLALDKWFEMRAQSTRADTLPVVQALIRHPRFNAHNPNRVRSLVGAYALRNFARFHGDDGAGYAFVADQAAALDAINPQLAAAIACAFNLWTRYAEPHRARMMVQLERLAARGTLSPDLGEIVGRALDCAVDRVPPTSRSPA